MGNLLVNNSVRRSMFLSKTKPNVLCSLVLVFHIVGNCSFLLSVVLWCTFCFCYIYSSLRCIWQVLAILRSCIVVRVRGFVLHCSADVVWNLFSNEFATRSWFAFCTLLG